MAGLRSKSEVKVYQRIRSQHLCQESDAPRYRGEAQMTPLEKEIERKLRQKIEKHGGLCLKFVCPGWAGVPDRIILLPGGRVIFAELKRPKGGKLSSLQKWWAKKLIDLGFTHWVIWDADDLECFSSCELQNTGKEDPK